MSTKYGGLEENENDLEVQQVDIKLVPRQRTCTRKVAGISAALAVVALVAVVATVASTTGGSSSSPEDPSSLQSPKPVPGQLDYTLPDYNIPWDAAFTPSGDMLYTEKCLGLSVLTAQGENVRLLDDSPSGLLPDFFCQGQSGMHGVVLDPEFGQPGSAHVNDIYVYFSSHANPVRDYNHVARITLADTITDTPIARRDIITDIMFKHFANGVGGRGSHSGGRILFGRRGSAWANTLFITSGDNHNYTIPQDLFAMGSKVIAIDRDGQPWPGNIIRPPRGDARTYAYGFRNIQGLDFRPGTDEIYIAEHGPNHSDEVTKVENGGNGGWDPKDRPGLNCPDNYCGYAGNPTTMPMTDFERFPDALVPVWQMDLRSAGMGPCMFLDGSQWGEYEGWLAVGIMGGLAIRQGDQTIVLLQLNDAGELLNVMYPSAIQKGRYRSLVMAPSGNLLAIIERRPSGGDILEITPQELLQFSQAQEDEIYNKGN